MVYNFINYFGFSYFTTYFIFIFLEFERFFSKFQVEIAFLKFASIFSLMYTTYVVYYTTKAVYYTTNVV